MPSMRFGVIFFQPEESMPARPRKYGMHRAMQSAAQSEKIFPCFGIYSQYEVTTDPTNNYQPVREEAPKLQMQQTDRQTSGAGVLADVRRTG